MSTNHILYINRCLQIAKNGIGTTRPNPSVGAVIVCNDLIIGEGFTSTYGGSHAEVIAIASVKDKTLLAKSTMYVTLEPCSHFGKTPPCASLITSHNIPNVVIGCIDDNDLVSGKGIKMLQDAGCNVTVGVLEDECKLHHKKFFTVQNKKRPYIILKWAETLKGFIAPKTKENQEPIWISNRFSKQLVHKYRANEHAILVGTNTVIADNPKLNVRTWFGNNPIRVVLDKSLRIPKELNVYNDTVKTIFITDRKTELLAHDFKNICFEQIDFEKPIGIQICNVLQNHKIQSVIIEGGTQTLETFISEGLWDEAKIFSGKNEFKEGVKAPKVSGKIIKEENISGDTLKIILND